MKSYRNTQEIQRKETWGRRLSMAGLAILFVGLMSSFIPSWYPPDQPVEGAMAQFLQLNWPWISFAALPAGFIFASLGSYFINRFARRRWPGSKGFARPDEMLERSMKGFDDKYSYFSWSLPANYVVAGPCGIITLSVRSDRGRVTVKGDKWREPFSIGRIFTVFAREGVGNPTYDIEEQQRKLHELLAKSDNAEVLTNVPMSGAVVFLNSDMQLELENPSVPALRSDQVKEFIRRTAREAKLQSKTSRMLTDYLREQSNYQEA